MYIREEWSLYVYKYLMATMQGIKAIPVQVEVDVSPGLPGFSMVGTVNSQVREAQGSRADGTA